MRISTLIGSVAINAAVLGLLALLSGSRAEPPAREPVAIEVIDVPVQPSEPPADDGGGGGLTGLALPAAASATLPSHAAPPVAREPAAAPSEPAATPSPWAEVDVHVENGDRAASAADTEASVGTGSQTSNGNGAGDGNGIGDGIGDGVGNGIGDGNGAGHGHGNGRGLASSELRTIAELRAPKPSYARPAKLLHPTRETEVEDAELFVAVVTVDTDGDVVGARMMRSHPGSRGDTASSMIWQFRYSPALDDDGKPTRSTFEQKFAVR